MTARRKRFVYRLEIEIMGAANTDEELLRAKLEDVLAYSHVQKDIDTALFASSDRLSVDVDVIRVVGIEP